MTILDRTVPSLDGATAICPLQRLTPCRGVAALVDDVAVALFLLDDGSLHAVDNTDPVSGASILSRGLVGDVSGEPTVASPMFKQRYELLSGRCLDKEGVSIDVHTAWTVDGMVYVQLNT